MLQDVDSAFAAHLAVVRERTDEALRASGHDGLVIFSGRPAYRFLDDQTYPFRPNPHFLHWAPLLNAPDSFIRYLPGQRPLLVFCQPADYWYQPPAVPEGSWTREFDWQLIREPAAARAVLHSERARLAFVGEYMSEFDAFGFASCNAQPLLDHLHFHRAVKTDYEVQCLRRASSLAARAHRVAMSAFHAGASEYEVHQAYCSATALCEQELPYGNIVAFGENAAVLHYQNLARERDRPRASCLIDAGAAFRGYASDITRTYSGGDSTFRQLIGAMDSLQQRLCGAVRAGTDYTEVHLLAHRLIAQLLREVDVLSCDEETALAEGLTSVFFPHGVGHLLGLQVHDVAGLARDPSGAQIARPPGHPFLRLTRTLEPGFVVTVEPGIYFIGLLLDEARAAKSGRHIRWDTVQRLKPFGGIRIEDDVLCTAGEPENLTRIAFAELAQTAVSLAS